MDKKSIKLYQTEKNATQDSRGNRETVAMPSYFAIETRMMENNRRKIEQYYERQNFAAVQQIDHYDELSNSNTTVSENGLEAEGSYDNGIQAHPLLNGQRFDGSEGDTNAKPQNGTEARRKFDQARESQEEAKQHRLGLGLTFQKKFNPFPGING